MSRASDRAIRLYENDPAFHATVEWLVGFITERNYDADVMVDLSQMVAERVNQLAFEALCRACDAPRSTP